jgi:predicted nucleic acid-binding protein
MLTAFVSVACGRVPVPDVLIAVTALAHERPLITATLRH